MEIDYEEEPDWMPLVKIEEGISDVQVRLSNPISLSIFK